MHIFVLGYPGDVGGANTELWHTIKLWRRLDVAVTLIPTWTAEPRWQRRLDALGCRTAVSDRHSLGAVEGLPGSIVVGFCNSQFLACGQRLKELGCRTVWVSCMNWLFPEERLLYRRLGTFARHVFQSRYQRNQLVPQLRRYDFHVAQAAVIRGAIDADEFPLEPLPHAAHEAFCLGHVSRAEPDKFARNLWQVYGRVPHPVRVRVLGWSEAIARHAGTPPPWAECFAAGSLDVGPFMKTLHAMVVPGGSAVENWPRIGLEAMAAGVPLVVKAEGGWNEMLRHGETGFLCHTEEEMAYYTARLAYDETYRLEMVRQARAALVDDLAEPSAIGRQWLELLEALT
jgi:glycosyltransferase involved in cell wall biosynthesis